MTTGCAQEAAVPLSSSISITREGEKENTENRTKKRREQGERRYRRGTHERKQRKAKRPDR